MNQELNILAKQLRGNLEWQCWHSYLFLMGLFQNNGLSHTKGDLSLDGEVCCFSLLLIPLVSWGNSLMDSNITWKHIWTQNIPEVSWEGIILLDIFINHCQSVSYTAKENFNIIINVNHSHRCTLAIQPHLFSTLLCVFPALDPPQWISSIDQQALIVQWQTSSK